ncbi:MAG: response regulator transcription factor [Treponema sp.]|jgi:DNA-binding NarL/FixJ family response regulator|nr:response regulator transcription factor [Treponema sp.]
MMIRIVIVDDQKNERDNIQALLSSQKDFEVVGVGKDGYDALRLTMNHQPDIALLNYRLSLLESYDTIATIKYRSPKTNVIILTPFQEDDNILKAIYNGASGYLLKTADKDEIIAGIYTVYNGGSLMSSTTVARAFRLLLAYRRAGFSDKLPSCLPAPNGQQQMVAISRLDLQLLTLVGQGLENKEIAELLNLKAGTVRNHITALLQKIGLKNRTQLATYAQSIGLVKGGLVSRHLPPLHFERPLPQLPFLKDLARGSITLRHFAAQGLPEDQPEQRPAGDSTPKP